MSVILTAVAQVRKRPQFVYMPFKLSPPWHFLTYFIWKSASPNKTIDSTPEIRTSSDVIWRHMFTNIINTDDSQVTWLGHVTDIILETNPLKLLFSLALESTNFSIYSGRKSLFGRRLFSSDQMTNNTWSYSSHFPTTADRIQCSTLWAVIVIFLSVIFSLESNFNFFVWCKLNIQVTKFNS